MLGAFAEFERAILRERTKLDWTLPVSRVASEGVVQSSGPTDRTKSFSMVSAGTKTAADAARLFNVHPATVSRLLARAGAIR